VPRCPPCQSVGRARVAPWVPANRRGCFCDAFDEPAAAQGVTGHCYSGRFGQPRAAGGWAASGALLWVAARGSLLPAPSLTSCPRNCARFERLKPLASPRSFPHRGLGLPQPQIGPWRSARTIGGKPNLLRPACQSLLRRRYGPLLAAARRYSPPALLAAASVLRRAVEAGAACTRCAAVIGRRSKAK